MEFTKAQLAKIDLTKLSPAELAELDELLTIEHRRGMELSLYKFFKEAWKTLEPVTPLVDSWHYEYLCEHLQMVANGQFKAENPESDGLIINIPPRSLKSTIVSVIFPVWCWLQDPAKRFIAASYALSLSVALNVKRRDLILSPWFQDLWGVTGQSPKFELKYDSTKKEEFHNLATGCMITAGVGGTLTGRGGNILICDDPLNPEQSASDAERATANRWMDETFLTRRDDPSKDTCIIVMQRLHEDDTTGFLQTCSDKWVSVVIPMEAEEDEVITFPISGKRIVRKKGNVLTPTRNTPQVVKALKRSPRKWAGQMQQHPAPKSGNIIKREWIRFYGDPNDPTSPSCPTEFKRGIQSWDMSFKGSKYSDYVCGLMVGMNGADRFLLDRVYRQLSFTQTVTAVQKLKEKFPWAKEVLVEEKANGAAVIDFLSSKVSGMIPINPTADKKERLELASFAVESGNWYFPHPSIAPWVDEFINNLCLFPACKHDDDVDAFSQVESRLSKGGGSYAFSQYYDRLLKGEVTGIKHGDVELVMDENTPVDSAGFPIPPPNKTHFSPQEAHFYGLDRR